MFGVDNDRHGDVELAELPAATYAPSVSAHLLGLHEHGVSAVVRRRPECRRRGMTA
jgi:hypothetical protein